MWMCPECGGEFVDTYQWHSCGQATVEGWLERVGLSGKALYWRFEALIRACGEVHVAPAKTCIAFLGQVEFAAVTRISDEEMVCTFALPHALDSPRVARVEEVVPGWFVHTLVVTAPDELDDEVQAWVRESYKLMGMRERLRKRP